MFDRKSKLFRRFRALRRRTNSVTTPQLFLDLLAQLATACIFVVPVAWAIRSVPAAERPAAWLQMPWPVYLYLACVIFVPFYRTFLVRKFPNKRLEQLRKDRPVILSSAIGQLNHLLHGGGDVQVWVDVSQAQRKILNAILGEVESLVADMEGVYVEVNLIVPHPTDDTQLRCIERARSRRDIPRDYPRKGMLVWRCMDELSRQHQPDYRPERGQQYRSIICFPLYSRPRWAEDLTDVFGAVSIDHGEPFEFDGIEDELEERIAPYLRLLEHLFVMQRSAPLAKPRR